MDRTKIANVVILHNAKIQLLSDKKRMVQAERNKIFGDRILLEDLLHELRNICGGLEKVYIMLRNVAEFFVMVH